MARNLNRLTARNVTSIKPPTQTPSKHADGGGLYLLVKPSGARSWTFLFRWLGKRREMGLGGVNAVDLAEARDKAAEARALVARGVNPIEHRALLDRARRDAKAAEQFDRPPTFGEFADSVIIDRDPWKSANGRRQWVRSFEVHCASIRHKACDEITVGDVHSVLKPIWLTTPVSAGKTLSRIRHVLGAARVRGLRSGDNPATWPDNLALLLPSHKKLASRGHHRALPFEQMPGFLARLRTQTGYGSRALEFTILTVLRTSEVIGARWDEIDFEAKIWTVPAERMKRKIEHRVPLSNEAIAFLETLARSHDRASRPFLFPGSKSGMPISTGTMDGVLTRMGVDDICTVHGMRSSFRDWVSEKTNFASEVAEMALAHTVGKEVERAYRRGDMLGKRVPLMEAWAKFCTSRSKPLASPKPSPTRDCARAIPNGTGWERGRAQLVGVTGAREPHDTA